MTVAIEAVQILPFTVTNDGTIRITGTRVTLDSIVHQYKQGLTPEEINYSFPSLWLGDIHSAIAYYLNHRETVEEYLRQQDAAAEEIQKQIEADPRQQAAYARLRERMLARWEERQRQQAS